jgi:hypothetical protein
LPDGEESPGAEDWGSGGAEDVCVGRRILVMGPTMLGMIPPSPPPPDADDGEEAGGGEDG